MKRQGINCPSCGAFVGWDYPPHYNSYWGDDPGFFDGDDTWRDDTGMVYCSESCLKEATEEEDG
jgi:hypothetical protein